MRSTTSDVIEMQPTAFFGQGRSALASALASEIVANHSDPEAKMWHGHGRALGLTFAITPVLCYLRDHGQMRLDSATFIQCLNFASLESLVSRRALVFDGHEYGIDDPAFDALLLPLTAYLKMLPAYCEQATAQCETTVEHHGYIQMQLAHAVRTLTQ